METNIRTHDFWSLLAKLYKNHELIKISSDKILDLVKSIHIIDTDENLEKADKGDFDSTELTCPQ